MTTSKRFLFVLWDGAGNVQPQLVIARRLVARGHRVTVLAPRSLADRITAAGCEFSPYQRVPEHDSRSADTDLLKDWEPLTPFGMMARTRERLSVGPALAYARDTLDAIGRHGADVVAADFLLLGAFAAAEQAGLPAAALMHMIYVLPAPQLPPMGTGFMPRHDFIGRLRDRIFQRLFKLLFNVGLASLNRGRRELGLEPVASVLDALLRVERVLVLTHPSFDFPAAALPSNVRYAGGQLDDLEWLEPWRSPWLEPSGQPVIVVSLSTGAQNQEDTLNRILRAVDGLPVRVLVTVGPACDPARFLAPANVVLQAYAPHQHVFRAADLVVTHAGHGTVITALKLGVPLVCLPMGRDQNDNAARVVARGAGLQLSPRARPGVVRAAIERVLNDGRFRDNARRLADRLALDGDPTLAARDLESLAQPR